jgi:hypothetical protein
MNILKKRPANRTFAIDEESSLFDILSLNESNIAIRQNEFLKK